MAEEQLAMFISYSRADSEFVDRLDADLRARGYKTWVDRYRLEGGQDWEREIDKAIAACDLFLLSLSQTAVNSPYVRKEYDESQRLGKRLLPVLCRRIVSPPNWLPDAMRIQQIVFTDIRDNPLNHEYRLNFTRLLYAIADPMLDLSASDDKLYNLALTLRTSDPERAAIILQHLIDRTPTYFGGKALQDLNGLNDTLYATRVARLHEQAIEARKQGQYGVEAASLEALLALGDHDAAAIAWARDYLPIALQNRAMLGPYGVIQELIAAGEVAKAQENLKFLWQQAPFFRDPASLAPSLGLTVPMTYEENRDRRIAREERDRQLQEVKYSRDVAVRQLREAANAQATRDSETYEQLRTQIAGWASGQDLVSGHRYLNNLERGLHGSATTRDANKPVLVSRILTHGQAYSNLQDRANVLLAASRDERHPAIDVVMRVALVVALATSFIYIVTAVNNWTTSPSFQYLNGPNSGYGLICGIPIAMVAMVPLFYVVNIILLPISSILYFIAGVFGKAQGARMQTRSYIAQKSAKTYGDELGAILKRERDEALQRIRSECDRAITDSEAQLHEGESEITAEYERALTEIAAQYGSLG